MGPAGRWVGGPAPTCLSQVSQVRALKESQQINNKHEGFVVPRVSQAEVQEEGELRI